MTDVLSGSIGIEVEQRPVRPLRQRGPERVPESRSEGGEKRQSGSGETRPTRGRFILRQYTRHTALKGASIRAKGRAEGLERDN